MVSHTRNRFIYFSCLSSHGGNTDTNGVYLLWVGLVGSLYTSRVTLELCVLLGLIRFDPSGSLL